MSAAFENLSESAFRTELLAGNDRKADSAAHFGASVKIRRGDRLSVPKRPELFHRPGDGMGRRPSPTHLDHEVHVVANGLPHNARDGDTFSTMNARQEPGRGSNATAVKPRSTTRRAPSAHR